MSELAPKYEARRPSVDVPAFQLPIEIGPTGTIVFAGTRVPLSLMYEYFLAHVERDQGPAAFFRDFPQIKREQVWSLIETMQEWSVRPD